MMNTEEVTIVVRVAPNDAYVDVATGFELIDGSMPPYETVVYASKKSIPLGDRWWAVRDSVTLVLKAMSIIHPAVRQLYPHELRKMPVFEQSMDVLERLETAPTTVEAVAAAHRFAQLMKEFAQLREELAYE